MVYAWNSYPNQKIFNPTPNLANPIGTFPQYLDPVQGNCNNCHLIAALSSLAWVFPQKIVQSIARTANPAVDQVTFYNPVVNVLMNETVWTQANQYLYTRSADYQSGELWPALYEKAYAKLLLGQIAQLPDPADPGTIGWGAKSISPLQRISGYGGAGQYATGEAFPAGGPYADWFDVIRSYCDSYVNNSAQTMFPGIAWTGAHTFSILGVNNAGGKWIIVRDPLANNSNKPAGTLGAANWNVSHSNYNAGHIIPGTTAAMAIPLANGIYGVSAAAFKGFVTNFAFAGAARKW
jgi:hypothetical protein